NCDGFSVAPSGQASLPSYNFSAMSDVPLQPSTDQLDTACLSKTSYDVCLFRKNPVAQSQTPLVGPWPSSALQALQTYGVKLTSQNAPPDAGPIHIAPLAGPATAAATAKTAIQGDTHQSVAQQMAYYWLNRTAEYIAGRTGVFQARGQNIRVIID